jgi:hypothetical protein
MAYGRLPASLEGAMRPRRASRPFMMTSRSFSLIWLQLPISERLRKQPRQRPDGPSTIQTCTQGDVTVRDLADGNAGPEAAVT